MIADFLGLLGPGLFLSSVFPMLRAWRRHRKSTLASSLIWAWVAWIAWAIWLLAAPYLSAASLAAGRYLGLCLIGCSGVAVLGARKPLVGPWNCVVLGMLGVLLLFLAEGFLTGVPVELGGLRGLYLVGTLAVGMLNYLPTRLWPAVLFLGMGCTVELWALLGSGPHLEVAASGAILGVVPWTAWLVCYWRSEATLAADQVWLDFRDQYGLVWALRVREQFNRSAVHAGLQVELHWQGIQTSRGEAPDQQLAAASLQTLHALLRRFGLDSSEEGIAVQ